MLAPRSRRPRTGPDGRLALLALAVAAVILPAAPADAAVRWVPQELDQTVRFSGTSHNCRVDAEERTFNLAGPVRNLDVDSPDSGDRANTDRDYAQVYGIGLRRGNGQDAELVIAVGGRPRVCERGNESWESADVHVHVEWERAVIGSTTTPAPVTPPRPGTPAPRPPSSGRLTCGNYSATVHNLRALRISCTAAKAVVRRYLTPRRAPRRHRVTPYTCYEHQVVGAREVTCRASAGRWLWFRRATTTR